MPLGFRREGHYHLGVMNGGLLMQKKMLEVWENIKVAAIYGSEFVPYCLIALLSFMMIC